MLILLVFLGIVLMPYLKKNKNLKESTRNTFMIGYIIIAVLYVIFGLML